MRHPHKQKQKKTATGRPKEKPLVTLDVVQVNGRHRVILPEARLYAGSVEKKAEITQAPFPREEEMGWKWAPWGANDRFPTEIRQKLQKLGTPTAAVYKLIARMYGRGLAYYRNSDLANGEGMVKRAYIPEVERWMRNNRLHTRWLVPQFADYRYYMQCFGEMVLNKRRDFVTGLYHKSAEFCRLARQDKATLDIPSLFYSPDFAVGLQPSPEGERIAEVPLLPWYDEEAWLARLKGHKFAYHSLFQTPGVTYYARPFWVGLFRKNGWVDVSTNAPEIINAMMRNQVSIVYQILIPESYFQVRYQDWETYTDAARNKIMDATVDTFNSAISGTENVYRSLVNYFKQDPMSGADIGKPEIIPIDDKIKKDAWIPNSAFADGQIVQALGLHPSQVGINSDGKMGGAGSGSDQRESFNTSIHDNTLEQDIILEQPNWAARFNATAGRPWSTDIVNPDWDITFFIDHEEHTTSNLQESGVDKKETSIGVE